MARKKDIEEIIIQPDNWSKGDLFGVRISMNPP